MNGGTITPEDWIKAHGPDEKESEQKVSMELLLAGPIKPAGWYPDSSPARPIPYKHKINQILQNILSHSK